MTFSQRLFVSGQSEAKMITVTDRLVWTKLYPVKFDDVQTLLFPARLLSLFLIHFHNPRDTPINDSMVICISMPAIEDRLHTVNGAQHEHRSSNDFWWGRNSRKRDECSLTLYHTQVSVHTHEGHGHTDTYRVRSNSYSPSPILFLSSWPKPNRERLGKWRPHYSSSSWYKQ